MSIKFNSKESVKLMKFLYVCMEFLIFYLFQLSAKITNNMSWKIDANLNDLSKASKSFTPALLTHLRLSLARYFNPNPRASQIPFINEACCHTELLFSTQSTNRASRSGNIHAISSIFNHVSSFYFPTQSLFDKGHVDYTRFMNIFLSFSPTSTISTWNIYWYFLFSFFTIKSFLWRGLRAAFTIPKADFYVRMFNA